MKQFTIFTLAILWVFAVHNSNAQAYPDRHSNVACDDGLVVSSSASQSPNVARGVCTGSGMI